MPKMKSVKAVAARFRTTASGKLKRNRPGKRHLLSGKTTKRKRQLSKPGLLDSAHEKTYSRLMGI